MNKYEVEVRIEISKGSRVKYEVDGAKIKVDRILHNMPYFFNYGEIPNTLAGDGDPIDVVVWCAEKFVPNCYIDCKIIGVLKTKDEKGDDHKLICVPADGIDNESVYYNNIDDLPKCIKDKIEYFFAHYKETEVDKKTGKPKHVDVLGYGDRDEALTIYYKGIKDSTTNNLV